MTSKNTIQKDKNQLELILQVKESPKWVQPLKENQFVQAVNPIQSLQKPLTAKHKNSVKPAKAKQNTNLSKKEKRIKLKALSLEEVKTEKNTLKKAPPNGPNPKEEELFDNLVSVETVAEGLRIAPKTIHNWVYLRKIPYVKCGQKVMFRPKSLKAWLNRKEIKSWQ
ncbi:MAG: helix-turn-helix domain-containing protein [Oligoflexia bacterium]|nr:helix-turn-helix domain-containing protein [Oligoflexia bacterium]